MVVTSLRGRGAGRKTRGGAVVAKVFQELVELDQVTLFHRATLGRKGQRVWIGGNSHGGDFQQLLGGELARVGGLRAAVFPFQGDKADARCIEKTAAIKVASDLGQRVRLRGKFPNLKEQAAFHPRAFGLAYGKE